MDVYDWNDLASFFQTKYFSLGTGISVGSFDGLHLGHRALLESLITACRERNIAPGIITFKRPLPAIKHSDDYTGDISTLAQRQRFFEKLGFDFTIVVDFNQAFSSLKGVDFLTLIKQSLNMKFLAEGIDFRCGYKGATDTQAIKYWAGQNGVEYCFVDPVYYTESDGIEERISSSYIRSMINKGFFTRVSELLARPYELDLEEIRLLGKTNQVLPPDGFYQTTSENGEYTRIHIENRMIKELPGCSSVLFT